MTDFDLVIRNGKIATAADVFTGDIGVQSGRIEAIASSLGRGREEIDAAGRTITPGGIDGHIHLEQRLPDGAEIADNFYTGSRSAACGGTTTIIPFAFQDHGASLSRSLADYRESAEGRCFIDYAFHAIITDPTAQVLNQELPSLVREGYTSYKLYMTYEGLQLTDRQVLDVFTAMRREQAISMVHAENTEFIEWLTDKLVDKGLTAPKYHTRAHPVIGEREATHRAMSMSELVGVPIVLVHVSAREVVEQIDWARARGLAIHAETCPQYLLLTEDAYEVEGFEGAKLICTPPPRTADDQEAIWAALARDVFDIVSSDHSPFRFADPKGKQIAGTGAGFHKVPNGVPGVETRMPLLFSEGVLKGRIDVNQFVRMTSTNVAKLYGLYPRKGAIAIGADADLVIWDTDTPVTVTNDKLHHDCDYTPYEGMTLGAWPAVTLSRGRPVWRDGALCAEAGHGEFQACERPAVARAPRPTRIPEVIQ
ncbi:MAG: dihydropyrimidinase [Rhodospirillaceae bacterium]|nr:dihydropyrimidinase [Rhodospirillaceae bacterium]